MEPVKMKQMSIRVTEDEQYEILKRARGLNSSNYFRKVEKFHASFDPGLLAQLEKIAEANSIDVPTLVSQLLLTYMAMDSATLDVFGHSKTWARAFQMGPDGLLSGDELSDKVYAEAKQIAENLLKKAKTSAARRQDMFISNEDLAIYSNLIGVKEEHEELRV